MKTAKLRKIFASRLFRGKEYKRGILETHKNKGNRNARRGKKDIVPIKWEEWLKSPDCIQGKGSVRRKKSRDGGQIFLSQRNQKTTRKRIPSLKRSAFYEKVKKGAGKGGLRSLSTNRLSIRHLMTGGRTDYVWILGNEG